MEPQAHRFGGGASETILHPLVALGMLIAIVCILALPRKKAITPFVLAFFSIPMGQVLVLGGVHFTMHQILILTVLGKMMAAPGRKFANGFNRLDKVVVFWAISSFVIFCLQFFEPQAWIRGLATLIETMGGYIAIRFLIPDVATLRRTLQALAFVCMIQGIFMVSEQFTHQNVFTAFGAFPPTIREGHVRSEGALGTLYGGPLAGTLIPMFLWLWSDGKERLAAYMGFIGATAIVFASHASTSWMAYGGSLLGLGFWFLRKQMRTVRWALVSILVVLHLVMKGPVWSLIAKIDLTGGSSSYHRYYLVDNCIRHFSDWWLLGCRNYGAWGFDMWDLCNQFVVAALTGGLLTFILYVGIFQRSFSAIGRARKQAQKARDRSQEWFIWCLGSTVFANVIASFGINYMVHLMTYLFCILVFISVSLFPARQPVAQKAEMPAEPELVPAPAGLPLGDVGGTAWHSFVER